VLGLNIVALVIMAAQTSAQLWRIDYETNVDDAPRP